MQAHSDVLNELITKNAERKIIKEYTKKIRKFYWKMIKDKKVSAKHKVKMTMFFAAPVTYTKLKKKIYYRNRKETVQQLFD